MLSELPDVKSAIEEKFFIDVTRMVADPEGLSFHFSIGDRTYSLDYDISFQDFILVDVLSHTRQLHSSTSQVVESLVEAHISILATLLTLKSGKQEEALSYRHALGKIGIGDPRERSLCANLGEITREIQALTESYDKNQAAMK